MDDSLIALIALLVFWVVIVALALGAALFVPKGPTERERMLGNLLQTIERLEKEKAQGADTP